MKKQTAKTLFELNNKRYDPGTFGGYLKKNMTFVMVVSKQLIKGLTAQEIEIQLKKPYDYVDSFK